MTQLAKPSAGALRAAEQIGDIVIQAPSGSRHDLAALIPMLRDGSPSTSSMAWTVAHIIDRETGVAELLAAAKETLAGAEGSKYSMVNSTLHLSRLRNAIAKCERSVQG